MKPLLVRRIAAIYGFLGVALGAFGAHSLKPLLAHNETFDQWNKAVLYHLIHAVALLAVASTPRERAPKVAVLCFAVGIAIFSGSLYTLAITNIRWLGAITPFGGVAFLVGWGCLVCASDMRAPNSGNTP